MNDIYYNAIIGASLKYVHTSQSGGCDDFICNIQVHVVYSLMS